MGVTSAGSNQTVSDTGFQLELGVDAARLGTPQNKLSAADAQSIVSTLSQGSYGAARLNQAFDEFKAADAKLPPGDPCKLSAGEMRTLTTAVASNAVLDQVHDMKNGDPLDGAGGGPVTADKAKLAVIGLAVHFSPKELETALPALMKDPSLTPAERKEVAHQIEAYKANPKAFTEFKTAIDANGNIDLGY